MHQEDDENYYDDDEEDSLDYPQDPYKHLFKFDEDAWQAWGKFLYDALGDVSKYSNQWHVYAWDPKKFPVNSYSSNTGKSKKGFQYLGVNYFSEGVFKSKYFIVNEINIEYYNHLKQHAAYFLQQPEYYNGLYDILN